MANTLTNLIPDAYAALDIVSREMIGMIPAVSRDARLDRVSLNENVRVPITRASSASDVTPAATGPATADQTVDNEPVTITKSRYVPFTWNGEQRLGMSNAGTFGTTRADQIAQAIRTLVNEMEVDLALEGKLSASRAYGTAGTTPFASTLEDLAQNLKILKDNGSPMTDLRCVIDTTAGVNFRKLTQLTKANEAGTARQLRTGGLENVFGFEIGESAGIATHVIGTENAAYLLNDASSAIGDTTIALDTGAGTIVAGDVIDNQEASADSNLYVVKTALSGGSLVINKPGLRIAWTDDDSVENTSANYVPNLAFSRSAIYLATRLPALPEEGDDAEDRTVITDPRSGISLELAVYKQFRQVTYFVGVAWGVAGIKPEHISILMG